MTAPDIDESLTVPLARLGMSDLWGYLSDPLDKVPYPRPLGTAEVLMHDLMMTANFHRYKHRLSHTVAFAVLASPSTVATLAPLAEPLSRHLLTVHPFEVERPHLALIEHDKYRYFDRGDGYVARFVMPAPGVLLTYQEVTP